MDIVNEYSHPTKLFLAGIGRNCFFNDTGKYMTPFLLRNNKDEKEAFDEMIDKSITEFNIEDMKSKGFWLKMKPCRYESTINVNRNTNDESESSSSFCDKGLQCPIYLKMKNEYQFSEENYNHLIEKNHFNNDYNNKPVCKYGSECKAFKRMSNIYDSDEKHINDNDSDSTFDCYRFDDKCHLLIYRHPPRYRRQEKLSSNMNSLIVTRKYNKVQRNGLLFSSNLKDLIFEVIRNGYERDLCLNNDDFANKNYSILKIVNEKLESKMHKNLGSQLRRVEMLSLILYTGCDCNYDLCKSQRNGNYMKWELLDITLYRAIKKLNERERFIKGGVKLYSGLNNVQLSQKKIDICYFPTYISTSYVKDVSMSFMKQNGLLIEMDNNIINKFICCNVTWISKFPDECEVLIGRTAAISIDQTYNNATLTIMDQKFEDKKLDELQNKSKISLIQHVSLSMTHNGEKYFFDYAFQSIWNDFVLNILIDKKKLIEFDSNNEQFVNGVNKLYNIEIFYKHLNTIKLFEKTFSLFGHGFDIEEFINMQKNETIKKFVSKMSGNIFPYFLSRRDKYKARLFPLKDEFLDIHESLKESMAQVQVTWKQLSDYPKLKRMFVGIFASLSTC